MVPVVAGTLWFGGPGSPSAGASGSHFVNANNFDRSLFARRPAVTNQFLPLVPGMEFVLTGQATQGGTLEPHKVVTTVTSLVKVIDGVSTVVLFDRDFSDGQLVESELAFQAQDKRGVVWSLGEYPEEYENGELQGAPNTWLAGLQRARAGVLMQAQPKVGTPTYSQGFAPRIDFADQAKVKRKGQRVCVPGGCFRNVLVVDESDALDPGGGHQLKFHAPDVGVVMVKPVGDRDQETLVLTDVRQLGAKELAKIDAQALEQDQRGYDVAPKVYGDTTPASARLGLPKSH
jgi:hypothetical protein